MYRTYMSYVWELLYESALKCGYVDTTLLGRIYRHDVRISRGQQPAIGDGMPYTPIMECVIPPELQDKARKNGLKITYASYERQIYALEMLDERS